VTDNNAQLAMPPAVLLVNAKVDRAVEAEWNQWYDERHLLDILQCPHFQSGARYVNDDNGERRYVTLYALSSPKAIETPEFAKARGWGEFGDKVEATTRLYVRVQEASHDR
jgi:hypothetical protein